MATIILFQSQICICAIIDGEFSNILMKFKMVIVFLTEFYYVLFLFLTNSNGSKHIRAPKCVCVCVCVCVANERVAS